MKSVQERREAQSKREVESKAYCDTGKCSFVSGNFLGRPRLKWRRLTNSQSSTIQNEPKSSSYLTKHLWRDRLVRIAFCAERNEEGQRRESVANINAGQDSQHKRNRLLGSEGGREREKIECYWLCENDTQHIHDPLCTQKHTQCAPATSEACACRIQFRPLSTLHL